LLEQAASVGAHPEHLCQHVRGTWPWLPRRGRLCSAPALRRGLYTSAAVLAPAGRL